MRKGFVLTPIRMIAMSLSAYWLAFIAALIGVVGTGVGVIAALIPTMLTGKRDYFQRLVNLWSLLLIEARTVPVQCKSYKNSPPASKAAQDKVPIMAVAMLSPLPLTAWRVISANGEFVSSLSEKLLQQLYTAYANAEQLNAAINFYTLYTSTAAMMNHSYPNTEMQRVEDAFALILKQSDQVIQIFSNLQQPLTSQIEANQRRVRQYDRWIFWLSLIGGTAFVAAIVACILLAVLIHLYG
jgi:hypothetical protein